MESKPAVVSLAPPLRLSWRSGTQLSAAVPGTDVLYGITAEGKVCCLSAADGAQRWATTGTYLDKKLARQGSRLFAYRLNEGLVYIDDQGGSAAERLAASFGASPSVSLSIPVIDDRMVYIVVNQGLYVLHQDEGLKYAAVLGDMVPHAAALVANRSIVVIDGKGIPYRYNVGTESLELVWTGQSHGINDYPTEHPFLIAGTRLIIGVGTDMVVYDLATGRLLWRLPNVPARAFAVDGGMLYAASHSAAVWAIRQADGAVVWQRQYIYDVSLQREYGLASASGYIYYGGVLQTNPDRSVLIALNAADGSFAWMSRSTAGAWAAGIPVSDGTRIYEYGAPHTGAYSPLQAAPRIPQSRIDASPRPLRGPASGFGRGSLAVDLPVSARVTAVAYREAQGVGTRIVDGVNWSTGRHEVFWDLTGAGGYTDTNQFGHVLVDIEESGGLAYTQAVLLPVNSLPDIIWHWARFNIEIMLYHKFVNGYADQTFKPDNLVTRAESSTIIAKTLGLEGPSPGFRTRFRDIGSHWARNSIMALEERGIVGGFSEPDGSFTFRPDLNMTRAEEARILVKAYDVPAAPSDFVSRFTDIAGHWAAPDIKALEAAGYVNGFRESDGTYTYRPEQNLTRAELCTVVVRIRGLSR